MGSYLETEFAQALVESHPRVLRYFKRSLPHEAEDLASEVLLAAWRAFKDFRGEASIQTLTFRISLRVLSRRRRQLKRAFAAQHELRDASPAGNGAQGTSSDAHDEVGISASTAAAVRIAISKLTPLLACVVELHYVQGKTQREISEALALAPGTVASRLRRARDHLRLELSQALVARDEQPRAPR